MPLWQTGLSETLDHAENTQPMLILSIYMSWRIQLVCCVP